MAVRDSAYGSGRGPFFLGALTCDGTEDRLVDCRSGSTELCMRENEAGVRCNQSKWCNLLYCSSSLEVTKSINYQHIVANHSEMYQWRRKAGRRKHTIQWSRGDVL